MELRGFFDENRWNGRSPMVDGRAEGLNVFLCRLVCFWVSGSGSKKIQVRGTGGVPQGVEMAFEAWDAGPRRGLFVGRVFIISAGEEGGFMDTLRVCVFFCGDEWKSVWRRRRDGVLFNHVPFFSGEVI